MFVTKAEAELREERQSGCEQLPGQALVAMAAWNEYKEPLIQDMSSTSTGTRGRQPHQQRGTVWEEGDLRP